MSFSLPISSNHFAQFSPQLVASNTAMELYYRKLKIAQENTQEIAQEM